MLAGCKSLEAISQFGGDHGLGLAHGLGFRRAKTPAKSALSEVFRALDPMAFEVAVRAWLAARGVDVGVHLAVGGKTARGWAPRGPVAALPRSW
jgi:hypothetical protein